MTDSEPTGARRGPDEHHIVTRRTARYFTLGADLREARDVWIVLHGIGQLAATFVGYFADLDDGATTVVAPEALSRHYLGSPRSAPAADRPVGASWMTREDRANEIDDYVAYLDTLFTALSAGWGTSRPRVRLLGFSQGAATACRWLVRGSGSVDDVILWGGTVTPDADLGELRSALDGRSLTIVVGSEDEFIPPAAVDAEMSRLEEAQIRVRRIGFEGGHMMHREALREVASLARD